MFGLRNLLVRALDRPGGRSILAFLATRIFRGISNSPDALIFWEDSWFSREHGVYLPDGSRFSYSLKSLRERSRNVEQRLENAADYWYYKYIPKFGDVIVDIGAGNGSEIKLFSSSVGNRGRVLAIEAHPKTYNRLAKTCSFNSYKNVTCVNCAVTETNGNVCIDDNENDETNSILFSKPGKKFDVVARTVDEVCKSCGIDNINYLKMNIEGAEQLAIKGMNRIIGNTNFVTIACHDFMGEGTNDTRFHTRDSIIEFLHDNGFQTETRDNDNRPYVRDHVHGWRR